MSIEFINADLEITSNEDLEPIKTAFALSESRFAEMYCGETDPGSYLASFEIHPDEGCDDQTAEEKIHAFCESISGLQGLARDLWSGSTRRVIDLGYLSDDRCRSFNDRLSVETLRRMGALGIELALTIYPRTIQNEEEAAAL